MVSNNCESYKAFCCAVECGNITAAADKLFLSQSTVSRMIHSLEASLGCALLIRTTKGVKLTLEGSFLYEKLKVAFEQIESAETALERRFLAKKKTLNIGASELTLEFFLRPYIKRFKEDNPNIVIETSYTNPKYAVEDIESGALDLAVLGTPVEYSDKIDYTNLVQLEFVLAAGTRYFELSERRNRLKDLENYPFISMSENMSVRKFADNILKANDMSIDFECAVGSMPLFISMMKTNMGIGFVQRVHISGELERGELFEVLLSHRLPSEHICLLARKGLLSDSIEKQFADLLISNIAH